jgi:hypothetical protein
MYMRYISWVEALLKALMDSYDQFNPQRMVNIHQLALQVGVGGTEAMDWEDPRLAAVQQGLSDLHEMGLVDFQNVHVRITQEGRNLVRTGTTALWEQIAAIPLEPDQLQVLAAAARFGEVQQPGYASVRLVPYEELLPGLGWPDNPGRIRAIRTRLEDSGCDRGITTIGYIQFRPTYVGFVRGTKEVQTRLQKLIHELLPEWETVTVEFKREFSLKEAQGKAKFVRSILALGTTKASGRRYYVVGFDPVTHEFAKSVDPSVDVDQLENILNAYAWPRPHVRYEQVEWAGGVVGVVEVLREPERLPYKAKKALAGILEPGKVWVRHGSHVTTPDPEELEALHEEGERADRPSIAAGGDPHA